eukprot:TRINITY_DN1315_c0_g1_i1.p1 TRINITY_DN1315_c0_g1~~TRINITY_DN1315_c0_g1_i1.p1  ORF type:complete len:168 (+),score=19.73 TRINITY_DN1315_c0_g1_i1:154-657(+)
MCIRDRYMGLHGIGLTHTDLKPENLLLENTESHINPASRIKLIDFGGATFSTEYKSHIINTRQYRAPEVLLQCMVWNEKSDIWSAACIIAELYTGKLLFSAHKNLEHIAMIEKVAGRSPIWMVTQAVSEFTNYFNGMLPLLNHRKNKKLQRRLQKNKTSRRNYTHRT